MDNDRLRLWDAAARSVVADLAGPQGEEAPTWWWSLAWALDGSRIAVVGEDGSVLVWHVDPDLPIEVPSGPRWRRRRNAEVELRARRLPVARDATCVAWSPGGTQLAVGQRSGWVTIYALDATSAEVEEAASFIATDEGWGCVSPDGLYRSEGDVDDAFWWSAGLCRFEPGEINGYQGIRRLMPGPEPEPP